MIVCNLCFASCCQKGHHINNKFLLYSSGNYTHYPIINHNGKEYEKEYIYIYIYTYLNHFAVHQKLTHHNTVNQLYFNKK